MDTNNDFAKWLAAEISARGWTAAELAARCRTSNATITRILNRERNAGPEVCSAIANALKMPPEDIFRRAGLLPSLPTPVEDLNLTELRDVMKYLQPRERRQILEYAMMLYRLRREEEENNKKAQAVS